MWLLCGLITPEGTRARRPGNPQACKDLAKLCADKNWGQPTYKPAEAASEFSLQWRMKVSVKQSLGDRLSGGTLCILTILLPGRTARSCILYQRLQVRLDRQFCAVHAVADMCRSVCLTYLCLCYAGRVAEGNSAADKTSAEAAAAARWLADYHRAAMA